VRLCDLKFCPESSWRATPVHLLPEWPRCGRVAVDCETRDPQLERLGTGVRRDGRVVGVSFAIEGGPAHYLPVGHEGGGNLDPELAWAYLRDQSERFEGELVGANLGYDVEYCAAKGVTFARARRWRDVQVVEPLLDELQLSYSLDAILERWGLPGKDEALLREAAAYWGVHPKRDLWRLPARHVGPYAEADARRPLELLRRQEAEIERQELQEVYDWECRLTPVLVAMRRRGVRVDLDRVEQVRRWAVAKEAQALEEVKRVTGFSLGLGDVNKKEALLPVFRDAGIPLPRTAPSERHPQGQESITSPWLETLDHPVGDLIRAARKHNKLYGTFCQSVEDHQVAGRIHCTLRQARVHVEGHGDEEAGARFGRLSCTDPNLQQQPSPSRDPEVGKVWRSIYVPDEGGEWACMDLSQQEPRWAVHFASRMRCRGADEALRGYQEDPKFDMYQMLADVTGQKRGACKTIVLGTLYGMGQGKLCAKLGLPTKTIKGRDGKPREVAGEEGQKVLRFFAERAPFMSELARLATEVAEQRGYVWTADRRRCRFPRRGRGYDWTFKALNRVVQGSSGGQVKRAMVLADDAGIRLQLQVHDELDLTVWDRQTVADLKRLMLEALPCDVPHVVDPQVGPNWGETRSLDAPTR
jgi:DNA polymerase I-like protein with 3'-5' exonuclease and polymerase domains